MPAPSSTDEFLELVAKSELLPARRLEDFLSRRRANHSLPTENIKLAQLLVVDGLLTKYQAEQLLVGRWRNFTIGGKYKLLERLGKGGMALVFLCEHQVMKRLVALKILPTAHAADKELLGRFHREARALSSLRHPNIVGAYDADQANKVHFLVMEYVDGGDLEQIVQKIGPLSWERAAHYIRQAALGLQHAHECGLVHRDVKPGNLLVDRTGTVKLLDLGLARIFHETHDDLTTGRDAQTLLGTVDYLAPEQALNSHDVDIRADIYGLGATFYYILMGRGLFEDGTVAQKLSWHLHRPPTPISDVRDDVPEGLLEIIDIMLAKKPEDRFQTPDEVVQALEPYTQEPIEPPSPEELPQISRAARGAGLPSSVRMVLPVSRSSLAAAPERSTDSASRVAKALSGNKQTPASRVPSKARISTARGETPVLLRGAGNVSEESTYLPWFRQPRNIAGIAAGLLGLAIGGSWLFSGPPKNGELSPAPIGRAPGSAPGAEPTTVASTTPTSASAANLAPSADQPADSSILLNSGSGPVRPFPNLRDALKAAKAGDKVVVRGSLLLDAVDLSDVEGFPKDVTLEGVNTRAKGQPIRWRAPKDISLGRALLDVSGLEGFHLKGFVFDGQGRIPELVRLSGQGAGSTLENLQFQGSTRASIVIRAWAGDSGRPATIQNVQFSTNSESESAILFETDPDRPSDATTSVKIFSCRFAGPFQSAILVGGQLNGLEVEQCRFFRSTDGFRYRKTDTREPIRVKFANNTFSELQRGIHFETTPPAAKSEIVVRNNLFTGTPRLASLDKVSVEPSRFAARWIWTDEVKKSGSAPAGARQFRKTFDIATLPEKATLDIGCDETFTVWINGSEVMKDPSPYFTQRVYSLDVTSKLRKGRNVLAVTGTNQLDRLDSKYGTSAGLLAQITAKAGSQENVLVKTDETWKFSEAATEGWLKPEFDEKDWLIVRKWPEDGQIMPWKFSVWDSAINAQLKPPLEPIKILGSGNIRDYKSWEGYPTVDSERVAVQDTEIPKDLMDELRFLRYPKSSPLATAGPNGTAVGVFDEK